MKYKTNNPLIQDSRFMIHEWGFTLAELMVSLGLFVVVLALTAVIFSRGLAHQRTLIDLVHSASNASLAMEQMAREIRTGTDFCIDAPCDSSTLALRNAKGEAVTYVLAGDRLVRSVNGAEPTPFVGEEVKVSSMLFAVRGVDPFDDTQPRITIVMSWSSRRQGVPSIAARLQTTISPRLLDQ